jgi:type IV secretory pathway VirJ component
MPRGLAAFLPKRRAALLALILGLAACGAGPPPEIRDAGRLGKVEIYRAQPPPRGLVYLFSGADGPGLRLEGAARSLAKDGATVVLVDLRAYLRGLAASGDGCHYVVAELEALSQQLQREMGYERYHSPLLAGEGAGGTLAYAALAQSPAATVGGAVAVDPAPALATTVPLCAGAPFEPAAGGGFQYGARSDLPAPLRILTSGPPDPALRALADASHGELASGAGEAEGRLVAALRLLLDATGGVSPEAALAGLPIVELPAEPGGPLLAVIWSGDGGWRDLDKTIGGLLAKQGVPVVGVDSLRYFWKERTPERVAADLAAILAAYRARWGAKWTVLIGYSFGAGILPFAYNRLPEAERSRVVQLSLLGLEPQVPFEFHVAGWIGAEGADARPVLPELERIPLARVQCFYGDDEPETLCRAPELRDAERIGTRGGHHFDGNYPALAERILEGARRRMAAQAASGGDGPAGSPVSGSPPR